MTNEKIMQVEESKKEKMTNRKALEWVLDNANAPVEVENKIKKMIEQLDKKSSAEKKPTARQVENEGYKELILAVMTEEGATVTEIMKKIPEFEDFTNQKVSALVRQLLEEGKIQKEIVKGRSYFRTAE